MVPRLRRAAEAEASFEDRVEEAAHRGIEALRERFEEVTKRNGLHGNTELATELTDMIMRPGGVSVSHVANTYQIDDDDAEDDGVGEEGRRDARRAGLQHARRHMSTQAGLCSGVRRVARVGSHGTPSGRALRLCPSRHPAGTWVRWAWGDSGAKVLDGMRFLRACNS